MEKFIGSLTGKKIEINCGSGATYRGEVVEVSDGLIKLKDEQSKIFYIDIAKVIVVSEVSDSVSKPGFIG